MNLRVSPIISAFILTIASLSLAACDDNGSEVNPGILTGPGAVSSILVTAEPASMTPEFLSSPSCHSHPPFRGRLSVKVRSGHDRSLHDMRFVFRDRFGIRAFPTVVLIPSMTFPTGTPVPLPTSSPVPIPGHVPIGGTLVSSSLLNGQVFLLSFDCGVRAFGTLFVEVETTDQRGTIDVSQTSVAVGN